MRDKGMQYKTGFNHGYIITAHEPGLAEEIINATYASKSTSEYANGLKAGRDMFISDSTMPVTGESIDLAKEAESLNTREKRFIKGFNIGHEFAEYDPVLLSKFIITPIDNSDYLRGIVSGRQEYEIIKIREHLQDIRENSPKKEEYKEMDKDR